MRGSACGYKWIWVFRAKDYGEMGPVFGRTGRAAGSPGTTPAQDGPQSTRR